MAEADLEIAVAMAEGPAAGLTILDVVSPGHPQLATWPPDSMSPALDLLAPMGRDEESARAYRTALELEPPAAERRYIQRRLPRTLTEPVRSLPGASTAAITPAAASAAAVASAGRNPAMNASGEP